MNDPMYLRMSLDLPRESARVGQVRHTLAGALAGAGVEESCRDDIQLALTEACANVVKHASLADTYRVDVIVQDNRCVIEVTDDGGGFNPDDTAAADLMAEAGRGLRLAAAVVDDLSVVSVDGVGTLLRLVKRLTWTPG
jgi:serine/threonine-protein kinase RsbW